MPLFQSIPGLNGLSKSITLVQKWKSAIFLKFLLIFKWNRQKKRKFKTFTGSSITLWARRAAGSGTGGCKGQSPLQNWMNFLKMFVSTQNWPELLRGDRLKLHVLFFFNATFSKYSRAEWVNFFENRFSICLLFMFVSNFINSFEYFLLNHTDDFN